MNWAYDVEKGIKVEACTYTRYVSPEMTSMPMTGNSRSYFLLLQEQRIEGAVVVLYNDAELKKNHPFGCAESDRRRVQGFSC